jgi:uncharacterized alpha-E superfamily protein
MLAILDDVALEEIPARDRKHWLPVWRGILEATGHAGNQPMNARTRPHQTMGADFAWRLTLDPDAQGSLAAMINSVLYNAGQLRDTLSPEAWRILARLRDRFDTLRHRHVPNAGPLGEKTRQTLAAEAGQVALEQIPAFHATADHSMLHDASWHFLRLGGYLERAIMSCSALRHVLGAHARTVERRGSTARNNSELSALLRMLGSQDAYRRLYQSPQLVPPRPRLERSPRRDPPGKRYCAICKLPRKRRPIPFGLLGATPPRRPLFPTVGRPAPAG